MSDKKRILVVSQHFWPENFRINDIVEGFVQNGVEVDVLCGLPNYPAGEWFPSYSGKGPFYEEYKGAHVYRVKEVPRTGNTGARIFLNYVSYPLTAFFGLSRLKKNHYDAVFCYETSPVLMIWPAAVFARRRKIPLTTYVLDLWPDNLYSVLPVKNPLLRKLAQGVSDHLYRRSDKLIAMSDQLAETLKRVTAKRKTPPAITVIPQYCEDMYAEDIPAPALAERFKGSFNILFAGNISPAQDLDNLVRAMARLKAQGVTGIRCLIVGDGMAKADLIASIKAAGVEDGFELCGSVPPTDIPKWTGIADALFAGLSASANLGLTVPAKITSYFAAAKPLLVAADGEANRVSATSGAALVSPAGNDEALAANILHLYQMQPEQRAGMGEAGRTCWRQEYSRAQLLGKLQTFILETPQNDLDRSHT